MLYARLQCDSPAVDSQIGALERDLLSRSALALEHAIVEAAAAGQQNTGAGGAVRRA